MLDARLALAAALYAPCALGADIGTDHALLPCHLLEQGVCERMLLSDVSPKALAHAEAEVRRRRLEDRVRLRCADGLDALEAPCGCVSVTGMGGRTIAGILRRGRERLRGAVLVLCAHTERAEARACIQEIGYRIVREEPCLCNGHAYVIWRAEPGEMRLSQMELLCGRELFDSRSPMLGAYIRNRVGVLERRLDGLMKASDPDRAAIALTLAMRDHYLKMGEARARENPGRAEGDRQPGAL